MGKNFEKIKKNTKGITLVALMVTIIILLLLAGISISMLTGENGLLTKTKEAKEKHMIASAREKLELVLINLQADKTTNSDYNENEFMDRKIQENEMTINGDVVTVDGWQFEIDRSVPKIIASLGKGEESQKVTILATVEVASDYTKANAKIEITSDNEVSTIKINDEEIEVPEKADGKYIVEKEVQKNGNYLVYVKTSNEEYKTDTLKIAGISEDTEIYTVEQLEAFRDRVNNGATYAGRTITLKNDLDLKNIDWIPIGNYWVSDEDKVSFNGTFDGENHTINNMKINITGKQNNESYITGFIGVLENGNLKNLNFNNPNVYAETYAVVAIAVGNPYINSIVENIKVLNGEINCTSQQTGGICGVLQEHSIIRNCYNKANINSTNEFIGGIAGHILNSTIESCYNTGDVYSGFRYVGGICGVAQKESIIEKCYNVGNITGNDISVGGIVGINHQVSTIKNCYNIGEVIGYKTLIGGIIGNNGTKGQGTQTVENVFNVGTIKKGTTVATTDIGKSSNYLGNLIGYGVYNKTINGKYGTTTIEEMKGWNNDTIFQNLGDGFKKNTNVSVNQGLPILKWQ